MKKTSLSALAIITLAGTVSAGVNEHSYEWGNRCSSSDSFDYHVVNRGTTPLDIKVCLERTNGTWSCFVNSNTWPGQVMSDAYVCHGTGKTEFFWRDAGDYNSRFPTEEEMNNR